MKGIDELDAYVKDRKLFRKRIRECKDNQELLSFLTYIAQSNNKLACSFTYKLACDNKYSLPFEDFAISETTGSIKGFFCQIGLRRYKDIKEFSYSVYLIKYNEWGRSFGVTLY